MDKRIVLEQENELQFETFDNDLALKINEVIVERVKNNFSKPVGVQIVYNNLVVLHYLMQGRKESPWLKRKAKTVLDSSHSSLYTYYMKDKNKQYKDWESNELYAICGGGFPIIELGEVKGAICVSGLDHLDDHEVITKSLREVLSSKQHS